MSRSEPKPSTLIYPATARGDVIDDYYGTKVADPYRWMEDLDSKDVAGWVAAQNEVTVRLPRATAARATLQRAAHRALELPARRPAGSRRRPAVLSEEHRPAATGADLRAMPSLDADRALVHRSERHLRRRIDVAGAVDAVARRRRSSPMRSSKAARTGRRSRCATLDRQRPAGRGQVDAVLRASSWTKDGKGFFYSRYPEPPKGKVLEAALSGQALYYHRVGTPQAQDVLDLRAPGSARLVHRRRCDRGRPIPARSPCAKGADNSNRLYYADLGDPTAPNIGAPVQPLIEADDAEFAPFGNAGHGAVPAHRQGRAEPAR